MRLEHLGLLCLAAGCLTLFAGCSEQATLAPAESAVRADQTESFHTESLRYYDYVAKLSGYPYYRAGGVAQFKRDPYTIRFFVSGHDLHNVQKAQLQVRLHGYTYVTVKTLYGKYSSCKDSFGRDRFSVTGNFGPLGLEDFGIWSLDDLEQYLARGLTRVVVTSCEYPLGEIKGTVLRDDSNAPPMDAIGDLLP